MIRPELEEAKKIAEEQEFQIIPISMELYSDLLTPIEVLRKLKNVSKHCYLLESPAGERDGRKIRRSHCGFCHYQAGGRTWRELYSIY